MVGPKDEGMASRVGSAAPRDRGVLDAPGSLVRRPLRFCFLLTLGLLAQVFLLSIASAQTPARPVPPAPEDSLVLQA